MKEKAKNIFLILLVAFFAGYLLVTGLGDLLNKKDLLTVQISEATEILEVEHSINGLIPTGKDHYYLGFNEETGEAYVINGSPKWYRKHFGQDGRATGGSLTVTALAKTVMDFDVREELIARCSGITGATLVVGPEYNLVLDYKIAAIIRVLLIPLTLALIYAGYRIAKSRDQISKPVIWAFLIFLVADLIMLLQVLY